MAAITQTITALPTPPNSATDDSVTFPVKADAFTAALVTMGAEENTLATQMNALAAAMNAAIAGGSFSINYIFSTDVTVSDPGAGVLKLNNATQNLATSVMLDVLSSDGSDWTNAIALFDDSTSAIKGFLVLRKLDDGTKFLVFAITALTLPTGYRTVTVTVAASSSANPFANGDAVSLGFVRNGDKGDIGLTGPVSSGPAFGAYQSVVQSLASGAAQKINFQTEEYDTNGAFDNVTNFRFQPAVAGYYQFNAALNIVAQSPTPLLYKNGVIYKAGQKGAVDRAAVSALIPLNGTTDYVELWGFHGAGTAQNIVNVPEGTYFQGCFIRPL